jgi:predicted Fe-Mo cluster-binding NifX family protein
MTIKIAIASTDGKIVNRHFGRTDNFIIVEIGANKKKYNVIDIRKVEPVCGEEGHNGDNLKKVIEVLSDCQFVIALKVGFGVENALRENGIKAIEFFGLIEDSLKNINI